MKLGCCAYSYRELFASGQMTMDRFLDTAVDLGLDGVELTSYYFEDQNPACLHRIRREAFMLVCPIVAPMVSYAKNSSMYASRRMYIVVSSNT